MDVRQLEYFVAAGETGSVTRAAQGSHSSQPTVSAAIANGIAVSKLRPFWSGFLIFSDFARGAIRLSALMEIPVVHIFTHDSIGVGEDGPTHQPVEQLVSLRAIPGLLVFRPADANEVAETWRYVAQLKREPAVLILSRQALPTVDRSQMAPASEIAKGAYVLDWERAQFDSAVEDFLGEMYPGRVALMTTALTAGAIDGRAVAVLARRAEGGGRASPVLLTGLEARLAAHDRPVPDDLPEYDQLRDQEAGR